MYLVSNEIDSRSIGAHVLCFVYWGYVSVFWNIDFDFAVKKIYLCAFKNVHTIFKFYNFYFYFFIAYFSQIRSFSNFKPKNLVQSTVWNCMQPSNDVISNIQQLVQTVKPILTLRTNLSFTLRHFSQAAFQFTSFSRF